MRHKTTLVIGLVIAVIFVFYMITEQVGFNEAAVVTTFGNAGEGDVYFGSAEGGVLGNLMFKWPPPIQSVRAYDMRVRMLEDRLQEQQTLDKQGVVVSAYVAWRITQPLDFYRSLVTAEEAQRQIRSLLSDARSVIGQYTFDQLTADDPERIKLTEVEQRILENLRADLERQTQSWGIAFESVGIKRLILPEPVTETVFERMRATRQRLAQRAQSEGDAIATDIRTKASTARDTILAFADRRAQEIRSRGDAAAAQYYKLFAQAPEFAIFLRKLEAFEQTLGHNTTFFFDTNRGLFSEFLNPPAGEPGSGVQRSGPSRPSRTSSGGAGNPGPSPASGSSRSSGGSDADLTGSRSSGGSRGGGGGAPGSSSSDAAAGANQPAGGASVTEVPPVHVGPSPRP